MRIFGNLIFAIIARMLCENNLNLQPSTGEIGIRNDKVYARKFEISAIRRTKAKYKHVN